MGYIGKQPEQGRYGKLDQISAGFNGSTPTFNLTVDSEAVYPVNPQALIISLNGVIQQPGTDFTVSAATITFTTNPASGLAFFGVILGDALDIGTPSDGSVTVAKMAANSVDSAQYVDGSIDLAHMSVNSIDSDQYVDGSIDLAHMSVNSIDSDQYIDGSIDGVHIANDAIDSQHYAAASIDNEHLADNAVDSAELAAGSVDIAHLSASQTASSSTFLRGDNQWQAAGGGAMTLIGSTTVTSNTGSVDFTGLSGYTTYFLQVSNAVPTGQPYVVVQVGDSSGFDTANQDYGWHHMGMRTGSATPTHTQFPSSTNSTETSWVLLFRRGVGTGTNQGFSCSIWIANTSNQHTRIYGTFCATSYLSETMGGFVAGERVASITMDRVRFKFHAGSIEAGTISLYGVSNA